MVIAACCSGTNGVAVKSFNCIIFTACTGDGEDLPGVGSVAAGGRYDELVGKISKEGVEVCNILHMYHNVIIPDILVCITLHCTT